MINRCPLRLMAVLFAALLLVLVGGVWADSAAAPAEEPAAEPAATTQPVGVMDQIEQSFHDLTGTGSIGSALRMVFIDWGITISGQRITLLSLFVALVVFLVGFTVARKITDLVREKLFRRFAIEADYASFLQRLVRFVIVILFSLIALDIAGIPLTVFAFLGGAIAIAVGFGGQELLGNFISGLILMTEKPIRRGDLIEIEGHSGRVEEIGPRCIRLRLPGNVDMLVPNRKLLEQSFINWTLTDEQIRSHIEVGVAYGSPTRDVERLLLQAANEHPRVDKEPTPAVLFEDFGDNALSFRLLFWVTVRTFMDQRVIQSDIRFRIDELFREAGITIAFPQHDVHLDAQSPIHVQLVSDKDSLP